MGEKKEKIKTKQRKEKHGSNLARSAFYNTYIHMRQYAVVWAKVLFSNDNMFYTDKITKYVIDQELYLYPSYITTKRLIAEVQEY